MLNHVLNALSAVGNVMDLPGSTFRDFVSGRNPFDQWLTPWHEDAGNRASGRDVLRSWNHGLQAIGGPSLISDHDTWGNFGAGLAAETLLDPTNLLFGSGLKTTLRANRNVRGFNAAQSAANADSIMKRARGFFPEENISKLHPALLTVDPKTGATVPKVMHHGTPHAYDNITEDVIRNNHENLQGAGHYTSESQKVTGGPDGYWTKGMEHPRTEYKVRDAEGLGSAYKKLLADSNMEDAAKLDALSNHHAAFDALEEMTHPDEWHYKDQLYGKGWQEKLLPHIDVIHTPGSPSNVRMAYFDIRNPFDIEAMHDVKNIKIPERLQGQPEVRIVKKPDGTFGHEPVPPLTLEKILKESHAAKRASHKDIIKADINSIRSMDEYTNRKKGMLMRMDPTDPKNAEGIKFLQDEVASQASQRQHRINSLRGAFKNRPKVGPIETVIPGKKVSDLIKHHIGIEHLQEIMRESGHDAIIHMGDRSGRAPHQVAIAYHPHQEYKPWIAPTIKPLLKEGSTAKNGIPLIANAILARQGRRHEER